MGRRYRIGRADRRRRGKTACCGEGPARAAGAKRRAGAGGGERRRFALKAVFTSGDDQLVLDALRHEFHILAVLRHPLIAKVYDFGRIPRGA
jgi:hypothetical protein